MQTGEEKAWEILGSLDPADVCRRTGAAFDSGSGLYRISCFSREVTLAPGEKRLASPAPDGDILLKRLAYFFNLSLLHYMTTAKDIPLSGRLVKPENLKGGDIFFKGSHVLPLDRLARQYGGAPGLFLEKGTPWGGVQEAYGDASFRLSPLPRVPVSLLLWREDDEFPARADILFDSTCEFQIPLDIIWSVAMMSILILL
jgi:hypothetical protein